MVKRKKYERTNNELQNTTHKRKDRVARTPLKLGDELRCSGRVSSSFSTSGTRRANLVLNPVISHAFSRTSHFGRHISNTVYGHKRLSNATLRHILR